MRERTAAKVEADAVVTEVIRAGIESASNQMSRTLTRTAFSPVIYEVRDFAVVLYDRHVRLLAQAESQPIFVGPLGFCVGTGGAFALLFFYKLLGGYYFDEGHGPLVFRRRLFNRRRRGTPVVYEDSH